MLLVADAIKDFSLTVSPETLLTEIVRLTENQKERNTVAQELLVVDNSQFLGVFKLFDLVGLISSGSNLEQIKVAEVMESAITLQTDDDFQKALSLMTKHDVKFLPVINQEGEVVEIVTLGEVVTNLQTELLKTKENLNEKIKQCDNLVSTNKLLQHKICDSLATEAQLLQTTSELQELFQAFPDIYFRLNSDGTVLSCHTKEFSDLYLPPEKFLGKKIQEILPPDISEQFQIAISEVLETNSLTAIEYSLSVPSGEKSFEARLQTTIGNHIIVIIRDITERKQAEIELQNAKDELEIRVEQRTYELKDINSRLRQEIIERQRIEEELRFRVDFEKLITNISNDFINITPNETDNEINQALKTIGKFAGVDRSYVFLLSENLEKINNTHEWCASDISSRINDLQNIYVEDVTLFVEKLRCGETLELQNIRDLFLQETVEEQVFKTQDIKSLIILPIVCSGDLIGFLGFESFKVIKWTENSIVLLKIVAETLGNVLGRKRVEQALRVSEERYARAISAGKVGVWEWNIQTNEVYIDSNLKAMLGYEDEEIANQFVNWLRFVHSGDLGLVKAEINAYLEGLIPKYEIEHRMVHRNGEDLGFLTRGTVVRDEDGAPTFMAGSSTDITARKHVEDKLKASLKEKEVLLKEIHHRVKNNLQIISSLLRLQCGYIKDKQALDIFQDSQNRVRAMALIHENLYQTKDLAKIEFSEYIRKLKNNLVRCYNIKNIDIKTNIEKLYLKLDTAIPCGLIINELISNSMKHAFKNSDKGEIYVEFITLQKGKYSLSVSDDGVGVTENFDSLKKQSLGLELVWNLVEQLEGTIVYNSKLGTSFRITFTENN
ncbi:signal transduction histidine kinase [Calothrix parasitica NIES-267]|uniref:histidine kinase n=1 Tax=Calothrix parasitica NIES-267 TaxID=1973488 RepID=A0A1Z4LRW4_9CYAN|nr:signal transduction histidine kinase [Calothrix parasitica NIES-267]